MSISRGDAFVFYSSVKACLKEIDGLLESGKVLLSDIARTRAELSCMKSVLERCGD